MTVIGQIAYGTVVRVLTYGALIRLDNGTSGLVHISEIDTKFVRDVSDYLATEDRVVVKILAEKEYGRYEFSLKQAKGTPEEQSISEGADELTASDIPGSFSDSGKVTPRAGFEDKMRDFLADSMERWNDIQHHNDCKLGAHRRR